MTSAPPAFPPLPIDAVLPALAQALAQGPAAVLQAPPGAGKTTRVPLALREAPWLAGRRIVMLEPRRLAARAAARRMAELLGEPVGATVGYRTRLDSRVGPGTRIEVVTEGILTRRLQDDPALEDVGAVLFDEFHERSLQADLGLALCREVQTALRDDLRVLVMSATLDGAPVARLLGGAPIITSEGRTFPVETRHLERAPEGRIEDTVAAAIRRALAEETGSILAFLPGAGEIRRVQARLAEADLGPEVIVAPLYGDLAQAEQDQAIRPAPPGRRKVVLATAIAETSLTIEGVRVVIDSGLMRVPRFDPRTGMTRLETVRVSRASADQRRGRAGRLEPGVCYRLWPEASHAALPAFTPPEILEADLAPLALDLANWGVRDPGTLAWLDPPPAAAYAQARALLEGLGALDAEGRITAHGRAMLELPAHPRLAHMMLRAQDLGHGALACTVAALLGERDILRGTADGRDTDLRARVEVVEAVRHKRPAGPAAERGAVQAVLRAADQFRRRLGAPAAAVDPAATGLVLAFAYPDRIAQRRPGGAPRYRLANGRGAFLADAADPLAGEEWLAVAELDGAAREARIFLAAPLDRAALEEHFGDLIRDREFIAWDARAEAVLARRQRRLGELVLKDEPLPDPDPDRVTAALLEGIRGMGLEVLPWTDSVRAWRQRVMFLRRVEGAEAGWPDLSDAHLLATLESWLAPHLAGCSRRAHLERLDLGAILRAQLDWTQLQALDARAPSHITVPSGARIPIDYGAGDSPVLAVRLQEMFGLAETPRVAGGRVPLTLHLLSPAQRPVQVTQDLAGFWAKSYHSVKAELKGRYPRHEWPDDPLRATPTRRAKPRSARP